MNSYAKFALLLLSYALPLYSYGQISAPTISNQLPVSAYVAELYSHTPIVDNSGASPVNVVNYQTILDGVLVGGNQYRVNSYSSSHQHLPAYTKLANGYYVVAWQSQDQDGSQNGVFAQMYDTDGQAVGSEFRLTSTVNGDQAEPALAPASNGGFVAVWASDNVDDSGSAVVVRKFNSDRSPASEEIVVNHTIAGDQRAPDITLLANGSYVVVWQAEFDDERGIDIFAREVNADLVPQGSEQPVNIFTAGNQERPKISGMQNGQAVVVWQSEGQDSSAYGVYHRRISLDGIVLDPSDILVNTAKQYMSQWLPDVTVLTNGNYVITYTSSYQGSDASEDGVFHNLYDANGNPIFSDRLVNTHTSNNQGSSSISSLSNGGYVIAWDSYPQDGSGYGAYFQKFDSSGSAVGSETLAAELTAGDQRFPIVGEGSEGGFVIVFRSEWTSGDAYWGVHARNFSSSGTSSDLLQHTALYWSSSFQPSSTNRLFYYRPSDTPTWINVPISLVDDNYRVDIEGLSEGQYEYRIDFEAGDTLGLRLEAVFSVVAESTNFSDALYFELTQAPAGMEMDSASGAISWIPNEAQVGSHTVSFSVTNSAELSDDQTATVTVGGSSNMAPNIISDPIILAIVGQEYSYPVIAVDEESPDLAYGLEVAPAGMIIDGITGVISWSPSLSDVGVHDVLVVVTDQGGLTDSQAYQVTVTQSDGVNSPPAITSLPATEVERGSVYFYDVEASDPDPQDTLVYSLLEAPSGMSIDSNTGEIQWDTSDLPTMSVAVSVVVVDSKEASDQQDFVVHVVNRNLPPNITSDAIVRVNEGALYYYDVEAEDPNPADILNFTVTRQPEELTADAASGVLEWLANDAYYVGVGQQVSLCRKPTPDIGTFEPVLKWEWNSSAVEGAFVQVMAPPAVAQLSDDNGDGVINADDIPDIIFPSFVGGVRSEAILRVISGDTGGELFSITDPAYRVSQFSMPAIGDIDLDGRPEIIALGFQNKLFVFEDDGSLKWELEDSQLGLWSPNNYGGPSLADMNQDGIPEIIFGTTVISATGEILWKGAGSHYGRNHWDGDVADYFTYAVDWDSTIPGLELIAGASVYDQFGSLLWQNDVVGDGYTAVANFDFDPEPELVVVNDGIVSIVDNNGDLIASSAPLPQGGVGGPPTVADMDGDGMPEIGVAGYGAYSVFNHDATLLWSSVTQDFSSHFTGSTVFDFDGDGRAEVVYADEINLYVYRGGTGEVLFEIPNGSGTALEYPVVADIDNDDHAELLLVRNYFQSSTPGIRAFEDINDSWVATRSIWNQYAYFIDNINADGTIPTNPSNSWQSHNSFRLNTFDDRNPLSQADLIISQILINANDGLPGGSPAYDVLVTIENSGDASVNMPIVISLHTDSPGNGGDFIAQSELTGINSGDSEIVIFSNISPSMLTNALYADISAPSADECVTENNDARAVVVDVVVADQHGASDNQLFAINVDPDITAPVFTTENTNNPSAGQLFTYDASAEGEGTLIYSLVIAPAGMNINPNTGEIIWLPSEEIEGDRVNVEVRVQGEQGLFDIQNFTLEVMPNTANNNPEIVKEIPCEFDQMSWLEISGAYSVSEDQRTFSESSDFSGNAIGDLNLGLYNRAYWEIQIEAMDSTRSLGWGVIRNTETILAPSGNTTWDHRASIVARTTYSWVSDFAQGTGGDELYIGTIPEAEFNIGDVLMVAWDEGRIYFGTNGVWWNNADPANRAGYIAEGLRGLRPYLSHNNIGGSSQYTVNTASEDFVYSPPFLCSAAGTLTDVGDNYSYDAEALDIDGDELTFSLTEYPLGMSVDAETGLVQWQPGAGDVGSHRINLRVEDGRGGIDNYLYFLAVDNSINSAPAIISYPKTLLREAEYFYLVRVSDPDYEDTHRFYLDTAPEGMTIDIDTGLLYWAPSESHVGDHTVSIRVLDSGDLVARQEYTLTYDIDPTAPTIISDPVVVAEEAALYQYDVDAIDPNPQEVLSYSLSQAPASMEINQETGLINWYAYSPEGFTEISFDELEEAAHINDQYPGVHFKAYDSSGDPKPIYAEFHDDARYGASEAMYLAPREYRVDFVYTWEINFDSPIDYFYIRILDAEENLTIDTYRGETRVGSYPQPTSGNAGHDFTVGEIGGAQLFDRIVFLTSPGGPELYDNVKYHSAALATVEVQATNSLGKYDEQRFDIRFTPGNFPPAITSRPILGGIANTEYSYQITAVDYNSDPIFYQLTNAPNSMQVDANGLISWFPESDDIGQHFVRVIAFDDQGEETEQEYVLTVRETDSPPIFTSQPSLIAYPSITYGYKARAYDPEGDEVHFYIQDGPPGMAISQVEGSLSWTPQAQDVGFHNVTVEGRGRFGGQSILQSFVLEVSGVGQAPRIVSTPNLNTYLGSDYTYTVNAVDFDETFALNYALLESPTEMSINGATGLVTWTPTTNDLGQHAIQIQVTDSDGLSDLQTFTLNVLDGNAYPTISSTPSSAATVDIEYVYNIEASDANANDVLTYSIQNGPNGATINSVTGRFSWIPEISDIGSHSITIRVSDSAGAYAQQNFVVHVQSSDNESPTVTLMVTSVTPNVGDSVAIEIEATDNIGVATISLEINGQSVALTNENTAVYVPTTTGVHAIVATAVDTSGNSTSQSIDINAIESNNTAPEITSDPIVSATSGVEYVYQITASDADGDVLEYSLQVAPVGMDIDATTGEIFWTPTVGQTGLFEISAQVFDGVDYVSQNWNLVVFEESKTPLDIVVSVSNIVNSLGDTVSISTFLKGESGSAIVSLTVNGELVSESAGVTDYIPDNSGAYFVEATVVSEGETVVSTLYFSVSDIEDYDFPVAQILSPVFDSSVSTPTVVTGTAEDQNFAWYSLSISQRGKNSWSEIASGSAAISNGELGVIDPTLLSNGYYDLLLEVTDVNGNKSYDDRVVYVHGDFKVGNFSITVDDLEIPLSGFPISISRRYDSREKFNSGEFGYGWSLEQQNVRVQENMTMGLGWETTNSGGFIPTICIVPTQLHMVSITLPDGNTERFRMTVSPNCDAFSAPQNVNPIFEAMPGTESTLTPESVGSLYFQGNQLYDLGTGQPYDPNVYYLETKEGLILRIDENYGLTVIQDPSGNTLSFSENGIVHSSGKGILFSRDNDGRVTSVTDPSGNTYIYEYSEEGDLIRFVDPQGNVSQYNYNRSHGLTGIIDPLGRKLTKNIYDDDGRLIAMEDADGNSIDISVDLEENIQTVTDRRDNPTIYQYDDSGNVSSVTNAAGEVTSYTYDLLGNRLTQTNDLGEIVSWTYDASGDVLTETNGAGEIYRKDNNSFGQLTSRSDAKGNTTLYTYTVDFQPLSTIDPLGNETVFAVDEQGNLLARQDVDGTIVNFEYDGYGNVVKQYDSLGQESIMTYDANGNELTTSETRLNENGVPTEVNYQQEYDTLNRPVQEVDYLGRVTRTEYTASGEILATVDAKGNRTEYEYDAYGRQLKVTFPDGRFSTTTYDAEGNRLTETDVSGRTTTFEYDALNRPVKTIRSDGASTTTLYGVVNRILSSTDWKGNITSYEYDAAGRKVREVGPLGNEVVFTYDLNGQVSTETDSLGRVTQYEYDALRRLIKTTYHDGSSETITHSDSENMKIKTDAEGNTSQFYYNGAGLLVRVTDAEGGATLFTYDQSGNKLSETDPNGYITSWVYDVAGRKISRRLPEGQTEYWAYDDNDNVISHTDFNGNTIQFEYDENDWLVKKTYPDNSEEIFTYTNDGNIATVTDSLGVTQNTYDVLGRLNRVDNPDGSWVVYVYDINGNRTSLVTSVGTTTFTYDDLNRMTSTTSATNETTIYTYDAVGNLKTVTSPNLTQTVYSYDDRNRVTGVEHSYIGSVLASIDYVLDNMGNRTNVVEVVNGDVRSVEYIYDDLYRLIQEDVTDVVEGISTKSYIFDAASNRISITDSNRTINYIYDGNNRLLSEGEITYTYDHNGNQLSKNDNGSIITYEYDFNSRLVSVDDGVSVNVFNYDVDGYRVATERNGLEVRYLLDKIFPHPVILEQRDASNDILVKYEYGRGLVSQNRIGVTSYFHADGQGSTRALTNSVGQITDTYTYDAYGEIVKKSGNTENEFLYASEQFEPSINGYNLRARYYQTQTGRFMTMDSFSGVDEVPISLHKYIYGHANPVLNTDPSGHHIIGLVGSAYNNAATRARQAGTYGQFLARARSLKYLMRAKSAAISCAKAGVKSLVSTKKQRNPCGNLRANIFFSGLDVAEATQHTSDAIAWGKSPLLRYKYRSKREKNSIRSWNRRQPACKGQAGDCDEYPFLSTLQGGKRQSSLRPINAQHNQSQGRVLGSMYRTCKIDKAVKKRKSHPLGFFAVVPTQLQVTGFVCATGRRKNM